MRTLIAIAVLLVLAVAGVQASDEVDVHWEVRSPMPQARSDFTAVTVDDNVYLLGGCSKNQTVAGYCEEISDVFLQYNMRTDSWSVLEPAPLPRYRYQAAAVDGNIYYIGGRDVADAVIPDIHVYSISGDSWSTLPITGDATAHLRSDGATWVVDSTIHIVGGFNETYGVLASVIVLNTTNAAAGFTTGSIPDKPTAAGDLGVALVEGKVYAFGGIGDDFCKPYGSLEKYDPESNTWTTLKSMGHARADSGYAAIGNVIYVSGGETKSSTCEDQLNTKSYPVDEVEAFDTTNPGQGWVEVDDIAISRFRFASAAWVAGNLLFNFGGQGAIVNASAAAAANPDNTEGYYPLLTEVYSLNLTALAEENDIGAASTINVGATMLVLALAAVAALF